MLLAPSTGLSLQVPLSTYCAQGITEVLYAVGTHWQTIRPFDRKV